MSDRFAVQPALTQVAASQGRRHTWLAQQAGMSQFALSRAINGKRPLRRDEAEKLASALQCPFSLLFVTTDVLRTSTTENGEAS